MLLNQALQQFTNFGRIRYAIRTVTTYNYLIKKFVDYTGNLDIKDVDIEDISKYYIHLKKHNYHDSSIAYMMISLRQFFKFLFLRRLITWDYQLIGIPKYISNSYKPINQSGYKEMLRKISGDKFKDLRDKTIIVMLYSTGLRVSELVDLEIKDIEIGKCYTNIISKKNRQKRMVFWSDEANKLLAEYMLQIERVANTNYLFFSLARNSIGGKLTTRSVQRIIAKYRPDKSISPHSFRHGLGMRAVQSGVHPRYIQKILGHKNLNSQQVYLDVHDEEVAKAYSLIST